MIRNKKTGQKYIGQSENIEKRFKVHCSISYIDMAIANEGVDNFDFIIIEETSKDKLEERERYWIDFFDTYNDEKHYNQSSGHNFMDRAKYNNLWDVSRCHYQKSKNRYNKSFSCRYNGYRLPIGMFHDFLTCEIILDLIEKSI